MDHYHSFYKNVDFENHPEYILIDNDYMSNEETDSIKRYISYLKYQILKDKIRNDIDNRYIWEILLGIDNIYPAIPDDCNHIDYIKCNIYKILVDYNNNDESFAEKFLDFINNNDLNPIKLINAIPDTISNEIFERYQRILQVIKKVDKRSISILINVITNYFTKGLEKVYKDITNMKIYFFNSNIFQIIYRNIINIDISNMKFSYLIDVNDCEINKRIIARKILYKMIHDCKSNKTIDKDLFSYSDIHFDFECGTIPYNFSKLITLFSFESCNQKKLALVHNFGKKICLKIIDTEHYLTIQDIMYLNQNDSKFSDTSDNFIKNGGYDNDYVFQYCDYIGFIINNEIYDHFGYSYLDKNFSIDLYLYSIILSILAKEFISNSHESKIIELDNLVEKFILFKFYIDCTNGFIDNNNRINIVTSMVIDCKDSFKIDINVRYIIDIEKHDIESILIENLPENDIKDSYVNLIRKISAYVGLTINTIFNEKLYSEIELIDSKFKDYFESQTQIPYNGSFKDLCLELKYYYHNIFDYNEFDDKYNILVANIDSIPDDIWDNLIS